MAERIIDSDGHVSEDHREIFEYFDGPYGGYETPGTYALINAGDGWRRGIYPKGARERIDSASWLRFLDEHGIESTVLYPSAGLALGLQREALWAATYARAYNRWLADRFTRVTPRLQGVALLPPQDPAAAAAELRNGVTELGFVGGVLPAATHGGLALYGSAAYHPLWEEAQRLDVPIGIHGGDGSNLGLDRASSFMDVQCLEHPVAQFIQLTNMLTQGVFDLFPRLRIAYLEAGAGWVPYLMDRLDENYERLGARWAPQLKQPPSQHIRSGNIFFTAEVEERTLPYVLELVRPDVILWASDYPHERRRDQFGGDIPHLLSRTDLSADAKRQILFDNPVRFYGLARVGVA